MENVEKILVIAKLHTPVNTTNESLAHCYDILNGVMKFSPSETLKLIAYNQTSTLHKGLLAWALSIGLPSAGIQLLHHTLLLRRQRVHAFVLI